MDFSSSDASATLMTNFLKSDTCGNYDPLALRRFMSSAIERDGIRNSISVDGIITQIVADEVGMYVVQYVQLSRNYAHTVHTHVCSPVCCTADCFR